MVEHCSIHHRTGIAPAAEIDHAFGASSNREKWKQANNHHRAPHQRISPIELTHSLSAKAAMRKAGSSGEMCFEACEARSESKSRDHQRTSDLRRKTRGSLAEVAAERWRPLMVAVLRVPERARTTFALQAVATITQRKLGTIDRQSRIHSSR
jgi:hypothetical protein